MNDRLTLKEQLKAIDEGADFYQVRAIDWDLGESPHIHETLYLDEARFYLNEGIKKSIDNTERWYYPELEWTITWCYDWHKCPDTGDWIEPKHRCEAGWTNGEWFQGEVID